MIEFDYTSFFSSCGLKTNIDISYDFEFVNKEKLYETISSIKWVNIHTAEFNNLFAWYKSTGVMLDWNRTVNQLKKENINEINIFHRDKIKELFGKETKPIYDSFDFDILMILMINKIITISKSDLTKVPSFYCDILKVYQAGHIPCGWKGKYARGKMLIY